MQNKTTKASTHKTVDEKHRSEDAEMIRWRSYPHSFIISCSDLHQGDNNNHNNNNHAGMSESEESMKREAREGEEQASEHEFDHHHHQSSSR
jgi:hypothetical protein